MAGKSESGSFSGRWIVLITVIVGTFLGRLDQTIVNLALPKIIQDFNITVSSAVWIGTAYILANAVFVPIWGKLGDTIGRKKVYILGFTIFIGGSVLAGLAWNLGSMIIFRIIQAIASSADYPTAMAILAVTFKAGRERAQALGIWSSSFAAAAVFGPLLGGPLIDNFGWRSIFLINLPVGLVGLLMAYWFIEESVSEKKTVSFDWWGALTLGAALSSLVLVLDRGLDWGWLSLESLLAYGSIIFFTLAFIVVEKRAKEPIVDFKFFKIPVFVHVLVNNFLVFMGMMGSVFLLPIFAQTFLGYNATEAGYLFIPMAAALMIGAPIGGNLTGRIPARLVIIASTLVGGIALIFFTFIDARSTAWDLMWPLALMAFGMGFGMAQRTNIIASVVPDNEIGVASSVLALVRNISGAFGISLFATILQNTTETNVFNLARESVLNVTDPLIRSQFIGLIELKAQILAYSTVFWCASLLLFLGAFLAFWIRVPRERTHVTVHVE